MTSPEHRPLGPSTPTAEGPAPFSVSAPTSMTLAADRSGTTTFTVSNLTGRPVRVRLLPKGIGATDQAWLAVVGEAERPLAVAGTLSADLKVTVPPTTPAGTYTARLDVTAEDATETVTGQTVSFDVPEPEKKKGAPVWLFLLIALLVLALIAGGVYWFFLRSDTPSNETAPTISGTSAVGQTLTATKGTWKNAAATTLQWQVCTTPSACTDIAGATAGTYQPAAGDVDKSIRVTEKAFAIDPATDSKKGADSEKDASSVPLGPVLQKTVVVPAVVGLPISQANQVLTAAGLIPVAVPSGGSSGTCDPLVVGQNPGGGATRDAGAPVGISVPARAPGCFAILVDPSWSSVLPKSLVK